MSEMIPREEDMEAAPNIVVQADEPNAYFNLGEIPSTFNGSEASQDTRSVMALRDDTANALYSFKDEELEWIEELELVTQSISVLVASLKAILKQITDQLFILQQHVTATGLGDTDSRSSATLSTMEKEDHSALSQGGHHDVLESKESSDISVCSDSPSSTSEGMFDKLDGVVGKHSITVFQAAPLVFKDKQGNLQPLVKLAFDKESELFSQSCNESHRAIDLIFDNATREALLKAVDRQSSCLHYSGHGYEERLAFEDGEGGAVWFGVQALHDLVKQTNGEPFKLVFVSSCNSERAGNAFVDAGVPHVVCCKQDSVLQDSAALEFTHQFYSSLTLGHTVQFSFDQGCRAVREAKEKENFILLPREANHDTSLFRDAAIIGKRPPIEKSSRQTSKPSSRSPPTPPYYFVGREIDMYHLLHEVLTNRLVSVTGEDGIGKSSLVRGVCQYISERKKSINEIDCIMYVEVKQCGRISSLLWDLLRIKDMTVDGNIDWDSVRCAICNTRRFNGKTLVVIDRIDRLAESNDRNDLIMFLRVLFEEPKAKKVKVILTGRTQLGERSIAGVPERHRFVEPLNYESTVKLFCNFCKLDQQAPGDRKRLNDQLLWINENNVESVYRALGNGVPKEIEETACSISREELNALFQLSTRT
jgi:hypothetical protein